MLIRPDPTRTFVIIDESSYSINDGFFGDNMIGYDPVQPGSWAFTNVPATDHNMSGSMSLADGHSEIHRWSDIRTSTAPVFGATPNNRPVGESCQNRRNELGLPCNKAPRQFLPLANLHEGGEQ